MPRERNIVKPSDIAISFNTDNSEYMSRTPVKMSVVNNSKFITTLNSISIVNDKLESITGSLPLEIHLNPGQSYLLSWDQTTIFGSYANIGLYTAQLDVEREEEAEYIVKYLISSNQFSIVL